jgi:antitoxin (DNA-binding transcriptional repressor) of toxin-antitoxin stability system
LRNQHGSSPVRGKPGARLTPHARQRETTGAILQRAGAWVKAGGLDFVAQAEAVCV